MEHHSKLYLWAFVALASSTVLYVQATFTHVVSPFAALTPSHLVAAVNSVFDDEFDPSAVDAETLQADRFFIRDIHVGSGAAVGTHATVSVHYTLETQDGIRIRDTRAAEEEPYTFTIGSADVIKGFSIGLLGMREGGARTLVIPPEYAYGDIKVDGVPEGESLVFTVHLISVR